MDGSTAPLLLLSLSVGESSVLRVIQLTLFPFWAIHTPVQAENTVPFAPHGTFYRLSQISHRPIRPSTQSGPPNPKTRLQCLFPRRSPQPVDPPERLFQPRVVSP